VKEKIKSASVHFHKRLYSVDMTLILRDRCRSSVTSLLRKQLVELCISIFQYSNLCNTLSPTDGSTQLSGNCLRSMPQKSAFK